MFKYLLLNTVSKMVLIPTPSRSFLSKIILGQVASFDYIYLTSQSPGEVVSSKDLTNGLVVWPKFHFTQVLLRIMTRFSSVQSKSLWKTQLTWDRNIPVAFQIVRVFLRKVGWFEMTVESIEVSSAVFLLKRIRCSYEKDNINTTIFLSNCQGIGS